jgi:hypothetical protein
VNANITSQLEAVNATAKYLYLNDADPDQPVFKGYPVENVRRLQLIRDKYDPLMIFTNLMPVGLRLRTLFSEEVGLGGGAHTKLKKCLVAGDDSANFCK